MATASKSTTFADLLAAGQSVWLDNITRAMLGDGELRRLIDEDGLRGMTSNPTIFEKAIGHSADYDDQFKDEVAKGADADAVFTALTVDDIQRALDMFRPLYDATEGADGYVSLEVSPLLAHNTEETLSEARTLWKSLDRPNPMIKIPGTPEGLSAIEEALTDGINVNVTLLFSVEAYEAVAHAYVRALQRRVEAGKPIDRIASVASFFVSRIDSETDKRIKAKMEATSDPAQKAELENFLGKAAIANAKNAYLVYQRIFEGPDFAPLKAQGGHVQRVLWASVGTKDPKYPDTLYIDELIGPETVSTMPPATFEAFKDHGKVATTLTEGVDEAREVMASLDEHGIDFKDVTDKLLRDGVASFAKSFDELMGTIREKHQRLKAEV